MGNGNEKSQSILITKIQLILTGSGQNTWVRLCSTHELIIILSLRNWERHKEKEKESSDLCSLESGLFWEVERPHTL